MHSADYTVARCLSVCLSVTRRYSVDIAEHILKVVRGLSNGAIFNDLERPLHTTYTRHTYRCHFE